jgi:ribonuclease P protein component
MATLHTRANGTTRVRVGVSTSTRLGNAVLRNRLRRRVRELVRARLTRVRKGWDIVFVVRAPATAASFVSLGSAIDQLLARAGLIEPQSETVSQTGITTTE